METYKATEENFLNWFFNTGDDQDQKEARTSLGQNVIDALIEDRISIITPQDILNGCQHSVIPMNICEGHVGENGELGDTDGLWEFKLI